MTRLIPEKINSALKREYRLRFFTSFCLIFSFVILLNLIFVSSSYLLLYLYEKTYVANGSELNAEAIVTHEKNAEKIESLYALSKKISAVKQNNLHLIESLFIKPQDGISIQALEMSGASQITIRGVADTRENMLSFQETMKQNSVFKDFSVPIESLARQKDITFNVTFTYYEN